MEHFILNPEDQYIGDNQIDFLSERQPYYPYPRPHYPHYHYPYYPHHHGYGYGGGYHY